jgi:hypothetical protein
MSHDCLIHVRQCFSARTTSSHSSPRASPTDPAELNDQMPTNYGECVGQVMFYCSLCGCAATSHEVSKEWKREERKKQQESSKRRDRERAQRQREQQQQANTVKLRKKEIGAYKVRLASPGAAGTPGHASWFVASHLR